MKSSEQRSVASGRWRGFSCLLPSVFCLLIFLTNCGPPARVRSKTVRADQIPVIRVGVLIGQSSVRATGTGRFQVSNTASGEKLGESGRGRVWRLVPKGAWVEAVSPDGQSMGIFAGPIRLTPLTRGGRIWVSGREYRGEIEVRPNGRNKLTVINRIDVENYLRGVVPEEIGNRPASQSEAVKAQAIAARTYALANRGKRASDGFDLLATVGDQVYRGYSVETKGTDQAIAETHGAIITYKGKMIEPFYSSTCGGRTDNIREGWNTKSIPYLISVPDKGPGGVFCKSSPVYRWTATWNRSDLERILTSSLPALGYKTSGPVELLDLRIRKRSKSGRAKVLEIKTRDRKIQVNGDQIRSVLRRPAKGNPTLRSTLFSLKIDRDRKGRPTSIVAKGGGYGHGIGLCQFGALGMAKRGYKVQQILKHYYRGIELRRAY